MHSSSETNSFVLVDKGDGHVTRNVFNNKRFFKAFLALLFIIRLRRIPTHLSDYVKKYQLYRKYALLVGVCSKCSVSLIFGGREKCMIPLHLAPLRDNFHLQHLGSH